MSKPVYFFNKTKYPVFPFLTDRTGVENNNISLFPRVDLRQSSLREKHMNFFTVSMIHLTTKSLNMKFPLSRSTSFESMLNASEFIWGYE